MNKKITKDPSIALVVLDTLRKDSFDEHFDWLEGVRYDNAWSTSHWTHPAHGSLFTGRYGSEINVHGKSRSIDCQDPTIAEILANNEWSTIGYSHNIGISQWFNFDRGFDEFHNELGDDIGFNWIDFDESYGNKGIIKYLIFLKKAHQSDAPLLQVLSQGIKIKLNDIGLVNDQVGNKNINHTIEWVKRKSFDEKSFLFINLMEAHAPYEVPEEYQSVDPITVDGEKATITGSPEVDPDHLKTAYDDCVNYLSEKYSKLHAELANKFDVIITVSDHGEAFGEYGAWEHFCGLWPAVTKIPMNIYTNSDALEPTPTNSPVSLLDVFATICSYCDIEPPENSRGKSLFNKKIERNYQFAETHGMLTNHYNRLLEDGFSESTLDKYDVELRAVANIEGYSFEDFDGSIIHHAGGVSNAAEIIDELSPKEIIEDTNDEEVPTHVEDRLNELGYM